MFPGGHPSKYSQGSMLLNFSDQTRTGVFNIIWPKTFKIVFSESYGVEWSFIAPVKKGKLVLNSIQSQDTHLL